MANYKFIELPTLIRLAKEAGQDSIFDGLLVEWVMRSRFSEMPACIKDVDEPDDANGLLLFDMLSPPDHLPLNIKLECATAVNLINEKRRKFTSNRELPSHELPTRMTGHLMAPASPAAESTMAMGR